MIIVFIMLVIIGALLIGEAFEEISGSGSFVPAFLLSFFLVGLGCAFICDAGRDAATRDYATGKITIEKIPVVTTEIR